MSLDSLRREYADRFRALGLPDTFDLELLRTKLAHLRGRPIELVPVNTGMGPRGLWVETETADYVAFERDTSPVHRRHIIAHEFAHIACGHRSGLSRHDLARLLLPSLAPETVRTVLGRSIFSVAEEREAELFATLLMERMSPSVPLSASEAAVARFESFLCGAQAA